MLSIATCSNDLFTIYISGSQPVGRDAKVCHEEHSYGLRALTSLLFILKKPKLLFNFNASLLC
jgi:hypothetical protein